MVDWKRKLFPWNYYKRRIFAIIILLSVAVFMLFFNIPANVIFSPDYQIFGIKQFTSGRLAALLVGWIALWLYKGQTTGV